MKYLVIVIVCLLIIFNNNKAFAYVNYIEITVAPETLQFHVQSPSNLIVGYNNGSIQTQIPNLRYYLSSVDTGEDKPGPLETFYKIWPEVQPLPNPLEVGIYRLTVYNNTSNLITSQIMVELDSTERIALTHFDKHLIYPTSVWNYEFNIPMNIPAPTARIAPGAPLYVPVVLIKVSTPTDLIKDLTTAGQLGYIGSSEFVSEITKKINKIEEKRLKPVEKDDDNKLTPAQKAKKEYTELLSEITEKYNKPEADEFVKKEAYDVLREDIEYIIGHL